MGRVDIGPSDLGLAAVGGEDDDGGDGGLEGAMEVSEALNVKHVHLILRLKNYTLHPKNLEKVCFANSCYLINEKYPRNKLRYSVVDVLVHHLVDLPPQLVGDLRLLRLHQLPHHGHDVLTSLGPGIRHVQVMKSDILNHLISQYVVIKLGFDQKIVCTSFLLCTSPFGRGTYSSASKSNSVANVSLLWEYVSC